MMAGPGATTINMHQNQPHQVSIHKHSINIQKLQITLSYVNLCKKLIVCQTRFFSLAREKSHENNSCPQLVMHKILPQMHGCLKMKVTRK